MELLRRWGPLALAVSVTLAATSLPLPAETGPTLLPPWSDKVVHVGLYMWMGWGLGVGLWMDDRPGLARFVGALAAAAAFAALDEWHQAWIPTRVPSAWDWTADVVGAALGLAASTRLPRGWLLGPTGEGAEAGPSVCPSESAASPPGEPPLGDVADLHTHLMPAVDDGAQGAGAAEYAVQELTEAGVSAAAATPHVDADAMAYQRARDDRLSELDRGWKELQRAADEKLDLIRGAEVRLDAPSPDLSDPRLRLGGGRAVLVEFASLQLPPHGERQLAEISEEGWIPVLAHPERYRGISDRPEAAGAWREAGAALQVNCGSLLGQYGRQARDAAWRLLEAGRADLLATDWHTRGPIPLAGAIRALRERGADEQIQLLLTANPRRILEGERPVAVPPVDAPPAGLWGRIRSLIGG